MASAAARLMLAAVVGATIIAAPAHAAGPPRPGDPRIEQRVDALVAQMTNEEKARLMTHVNPPPWYPAAGFIPGIERLGIPPLILSDGPAGVRDGQPATALPAPVRWPPRSHRRSAAATAAVIGKEAKARGYGVIYAPMVNIVRTPLGGRDFETLGEDPFLTGAHRQRRDRRGMQAQRVAAQVKHYAANNQENDRTTSSSNARRADAARDLPAGVREGRQGGARLVGDVRLQQGQRRLRVREPGVLRRILIDDLGLRRRRRHRLPRQPQHGRSPRSPGSTRSSRHHVLQALPPAVAGGRVPQSDPRRRRPAGSCGMESASGSSTATAPARRRTSTPTAPRPQAAEQGAVLLKNREVTLPLDTSKLRRWP